MADAEGVNDTDGVTDGDVDGVGAGSHAPNPAWHVLYGQKAAPVPQKPYTLQHSPVPQVRFRPRMPHCSVPGVAEAVADTVAVEVTDGASQFPNPTWHASAAQKSTPVPQKPNVLQQEPVLQMRFNPLMPHCLVPAVAEAVGVVDAVTEREAVMLAAAVALGVALAAAVAVGVGASSQEPNPCWQLAYVQNSGSIPQNPKTLQHAPGTQDRFKPPMPHSAVVVAFCAVAVERRAKVVHDATKRLQ